MNIDIKMPDLATTENEVTIIRWLVEVGQPVRAGQPLLEIETDKATMDVESITTGVLTTIYAQPGDRVAVGQVIATVSAASPVGAVEGSAVTPPSDLQPTARLPQVSDTPPFTATPSLDRPRMSMFARNKALRDQRAQKEAIPLNSIQQETARRLQASKQNIPHFYLTTSASAERMAAIRQASPLRIVWDAFFVQAAARALNAFDRMRYRFEGDRLTRATTDAIGVAVDVDDQLYVVPIVDPLSLTLQQVSEQITLRADQIRQGDPMAKKLGETNITITNLGAEGIESFAAIINPPEAAILAIGRVAPALQAQDNQITIQKRVSLTLSVDHRIVNGKYAARFLSRIVQEIESL